MIHSGVYLAVICFAVAVSAQQRCCMTHSLTDGAAGMDQASYYTLPDGSLNIFFENNLNQKVVHSTLLTRNCIVNIIEGAMAKNGPNLISLLKLEIIKNAR